MGSQRVWATFTFLYQNSSKTCLLILDLNSLPWSMVLSIICALTHALTASLVTVSPLSPSLCFSPRISLFFFEYVRFTLTSGSLHLLFLLHGPIHPAVLGRTNAASGRDERTGQIIRGSSELSLFTFMHWRRKWQPTPVFLPRESQGRRSLVGCHLWGHTESDTTETT